MAKKCSTDQRFIRKRNTTYEIHTLVPLLKTNTNTGNLGITQKKLPSHSFFRMSRLTVTSASSVGKDNLIMRDANWMSIEKVAPTEVDWKAMDIDELVDRLTPGEIQKLLEEFDPDGNLLIKCFSNFCKNVKY